MPTQEHEPIAAIIIVVARKADYLGCLLKSLDPHLDRLTQDERRLLREKLSELVAAMAPGLFVSPGEKANRTLNPTILLENLDLDAVWREMRNHLLVS